MPKGNACDDEGRHLSGGTRASPATPGQGGGQILPHGRGRSWPRTPWSDFQPLNCSHCAVSWQPRALASPGPSRGLAGEALRIVSAEACPGWGIPAEQGTLRRVCGWGMLREAEQQGQAPKGGRCQALALGGHGGATPQEGACVSDR